ncbi:MAG: hypothetical protein JRJ87_20575 [Deltaproteobacteria bacterium]|nr:hypothetical protein [Deltaproteobacteria bacterium]
MSKSLVVCLSLLVVLAQGSVASAAAPAKIPLQGVLADSNGLPLNGNVTVVFAIYDLESGGVALWSESQTIAVQNGLFAAYLGSITSLNLALFRDNDDLWLGIQVQGDQEMSRIYLGSTPFAAYAEYSGSGAGVPNGLIAIFDGACPAGWTRVAAFDGQVLRGSAAYGATGGSDTHDHSVDPASTDSSSGGIHNHSVDPSAADTSSAGSHSHGVNYTTRGIGHSHTVNPPTTGSGVQSNNHTHGYEYGTAGTKSTVGFNQGHTHNVNIAAFDSASTNPTDRYVSDTNSAGGHTHSLNLAAVQSSDDGSHLHSLDIEAFPSATADSWPPYIDVVYCKKDPGKNTISLDVGTLSTGKTASRSEMEELSRENVDLKCQLEILEDRLAAIEEMLQRR